MDTRNASTPFTLAPRETILLDQAAGMEVLCRRGSVWITQYGDSRDVVLSAGEAFPLTLPACVVSSASGDAEFLLRPATPRTATGGWLRRLAKLFDPRWGSAASRALEGRLRIHRVA